MHSYTFEIATNRARMPLLRRNLNLREQRHSSKCTYDLRQAIGQDA